MWRLQMNHKQILVSSVENSEFGSFILVYCRQSELGDKNHKLQPHFKPITYLLNI